MWHVPFLFLAILAFAPASFSQTPFLRFRIDAILNTPKIDILENAGGYQLRGGRPGVGFGLDYTHFIGKNSGISAGLHFTTRQYTIFNDINTLPSARYRITTSPRFYTLAIPLSFLHRWYMAYLSGDTYNRKNFVSINAGFAVNLTKPYAIKGRVKSTGSNFGVRVNHKDDFSFDAAIGYELSVNAAYNLRVKKSDYLGLGLGYACAPARYPALKVTDTVNGVPYEGRFRPKILSYVGAFITYSMGFSD